MHVLVVREKSRTGWRGGIILETAAIDFAGNGGSEADFLAKSKEGFRRIGNRDSLLCG
jgi:hypothetical protein